MDLDGEGSAIMMQMWETSKSCWDPVANTDLKPFSWPEMCVADPNGPISAKRLRLACV